MAEVGLAGFGAIVAEVVKALFKPIIRQISYVFKSQSYIDELKKQEKGLGFKRQRVEKATEEATRQGDEIFKDVKDWLDSVDEFTQKVAKPIIDDEDGAKKSCFKGLCPNLLSRYKLSKRAAKAAEDAPNLKGKGNFSKVFYRHPPESSVLRDVKDYEAFDSRKKVFQDVVEALKDDKLKIIGVYGMGGVGKTTLVKQVAKQVMEDKLFDKVVMAEVTQTPDRNKIQDKLAFDLGMKFESDENEFQRPERLRERLKKEKRVLVILDDIWTELELPAVGIPFGDVDKERKDDQSRCTIILTSRNRDLLERDMKSQKNFLIEVLSKEEALRLFENIVGDSAKTSDIQPIAVEIVDRCGGLPIALTTIANALKGKSLHIWKDALNQLRSSNPKEIDGMAKNVYASIEVSYNLLASKEAQSLFRLCSLYSEGQAIPVPDLLRYGKGMGYFENVYTLEDARNRVHRLIEKLKSSCLLLDGDAKNEVKMHDVIHVVAVSIAEGERMFNTPNVANVKKKMEETIKEGPIAISLPYRDIQVLPERLQCPHLKLFLLFAKHGNSSQIPDLFFEETEELKVLSLTGIRFSSLPSSLGHLINLQTLCLHRCQLEDVAVVGQLNKLEILSLRDSEIKQLPHEIGQLTQLQLLELAYCNKLKTIVGHDMEKLTTLGSKEIIAEDDTDQKVVFPSLEELTLRRLKSIEKLWPDQFQGMSYCQILKKLTVWGCGRMKYLFSYSMVNCLSQLQHLEIGNCESMEGVVVDTRGLGRNEGNLIELKVFPKLRYLRLSFLEKLTSFASMLNSVVEFPSLVKLEIFGCINMLRFISTSSPEDNIHLEMQPLFDEKVRFPSLEELNICLMDKVRKIWHHQLGSESFNKLKKLHIGRCDDVVNIFPPSVRFPSLEELFIHQMDKLRKIWHHQLASESFNKLKKLHIERCNDLMNVFPPSVGIPRSLVNLEVSGCEKIEEIIGHGGEEVKENRIVFNELKHLELDDLPRLTSFCSENFTLEFPSLERVSITHCPNMKTFSQGVLSTPILNEVQVDKEWEEDKLWRWQGDLNSTIQKCYEEMVGFRYIRSLTLSHFPRLREIWHGQALPVSFFNNLETLVVDDCTNMSSVIPANLLQFLNKWKWLEVRNCDSIEEVLHLEQLINADEEHVGQLFHNLCRLRLIDLPKLKRFCNFTENIIELPELWSLTIENCPNMETFVSNSTSVQHMLADNKEPHQKITLEENFSLADHIQPLFDEKVAFPKLRWLTLSRLPSVLHLWKENAESNEVFTNLQSLRISECSKLQKLVPSSWHLKKLRSLEVSKCHGLINLLTLSTSESLVNLEKIKISDCKMVEEIIQLKDGEEARDCIVFKGLKYLTLDCLPSLTSFCSGNYTLQFPSLEEVLVRQCPEMKIFSQGVVDTPNLNKVKFTKEEDDDKEKDDDDDGCWEGNLNDTIQKLFN